MVHGGVLVCPMLGRGRWALVRHCDRHCLVRAGHPDVSLCCKSEPCGGGLVEEAQRRISGRAAQARQRAILGKNQVPSAGGMEVQKLQERRRTVCTASSI